MPSESSFLGSDYSKSIEEMSILYDIRNIFLQWRFFFIRPCSLSSYAHRHKMAYSRSLHNDTEHNVP